MMLRKSTILLKAEPMRDKLSVLWQHSLPLLATLLLMFLFFMPVNSVQVNYFRPTIGVICVYFWTMRKPQIFGYFSAFCVGFIIDVHSTAPLGLNSLMMMLLVYISHRLARYFRSTSFLASWLLLSIVGLGFVLLKWTILMLYFKHILPLSEALLSFLSTVMFYPLIAYINGWIIRCFLPPENINE